MEKLVARMQEVLEAGFMRHGEGLTLVGKLQFTLSWAFGRVGRAAIHLLRDVDGQPITSATRAAIVFLCLLLPSLPPRKMSLRDAQRPPSLLFTDACYSRSSSGVEKAGVGFVLGTPKPGAPIRAVERSVTDYDWVAGSADVPQSLLDAFRPRKQQIGVAELLAAAVPYSTCPDLLSSRQVLQWIDNTGALCSIVKGFAGADDAARIVFSFHDMSCRLDSRIWCEYVRSAANVSDLPSRGDLQQVLDLLNAKERTVKWPSLQAWDISQIPGVEAAVSGAEAAPAIARR